MATLDKAFEAKLEKSSAKGGWTYVVTDWSADFFGTRGLVKVAGHRRRPSVPELVHGPRRRHSQTSGQGRPPETHQQEGRRYGDDSPPRTVLRHQVLGPNECPVSSL